MSKGKDNSGQKSTPLCTQEAYDRTLGMGQGFNLSSDNLSRDGAVGGVSNNESTTVPRTLSGQTAQDNIDYGLLFDRALHSNNLNELHGSHYSGSDDADNSFENFLKRSVYSERNMYEQSSTGAFKNGEDKGTSEELRPPSEGAEPPPPMFKDDSDPHLLEESSYHGYSLPGPDNPLQDTEDIDPTTSDYNLAKLGEYDPPSYKVTSRQSPWSGHESKYR